MKRLLVAFAVFIVSSLSADVTVDSIRMTAYDYACADGNGAVLSGHQRQDKAQAACATRKLNDPDGDYQVLGGRWRVLVSGAEAGVLFATPEPAGTLDFDGEDVTLTSDTFHSIGIVWNVGTGFDTDIDGVTAVEYKKTADSTWLDAPDLLRVFEYEAFFSGTGQGEYNLFGGSIMFLTAGTSYDVRLTYTDPDTVEPTRIETFVTSTRAIPVEPTGTTYYVTEGSGSGNAGTVGDPFEGFAEAFGTVGPNDILRLQDTGGKFSDYEITVSGTAGNYIMLEPDPADSPVVEQLEISADYIWLNNLTFTGTNGVTNIDSSVAATSAVYSDAKQDNIVVTGATFTLFTRGVSNMQGGLNWVIMDSTGTGPDLAGVSSDSWLVRTGGEGSTCGPGAVIAYNKATLYADGINACQDSDVYGNQSYNHSDDCFSSDGSLSNVRVWGNHFNECDNFGWPYQVQDSAPWYFLYNQLVMENAPVFKVRWVGRGVYIGNAFIGNAGTMGYHILRFYSRNNIWYRNTSSRVLLGVAASDDPANSNRGSLMSPNWSTDVDYNGYGNISGTVIDFDGTNHSTCGSFATAVGSGVEANCTDIDSSIWNNYGSHDETTTLTLAAAANAAVDAGILVDNLADQYTATPDLGPYQRGGTAPQFGPRSGELGTALAARTENWVWH